MTMIERVARAMYPQYEYGIELGIKDLMHATAKAAIEAMREPNEEMINAIREYYEGDEKLYMSKIIDAALKE